MAAPRDRYPFIHAMTLKHLAKSIVIMVTISAECVQFGMTFPQVMPGLRLLVMSDHTVVRLRTEDIEPPWYFGP